MKYLFLCPLVTLSLVWASGRSFQTSGRGEILGTPSMAEQKWAPTAPLRSNTRASSAKKSGGPMMVASTIRMVSGTMAS